MKFFEKLVNSLTLRTAQISQAVLAFTMLIIVLNVVIRIKWSPLPGTVELVEMSGAVLLSMAVGYTAVKKGHIMVGILVERFPKRIQALVDFFVNGTSLVFISLLAFETFRYAVKMMDKGLVTGHLSIPISPSIYMVGFGFTMLSLVILVDLLKAFITLIKGERKQ